MNKTLESVIMKKKLFKVLCFVIIFVILFLKTQNVLHYRWTGNDNLYVKNIDYEKQLNDSIDVLCFGTSEIYAAYDPIVTYHEEGITGYNLAIGERSAVTAYYQLLYALKYQKPMIVMCDFSCLYDDQLPEQEEAIYRKVVDTMPDRGVRHELIKEICKLDQKQEYLYWEYPLLRYHSMWNELSVENFKPDYQYDDSYKSYMKGALLNDARRTDGGVVVDGTISPEMWNAEETSDVFSDVSVKYYDKFIYECQSRGIQVLALLTPELDEAGKCASRWNMMKEYFDERDVKYLNYNTYEQVMRMKLQYDNDYFDGSHLNIEGSLKFSKTLSEDLKEIYDLPDRREEKKLAVEWNSSWEEFQADKLNRID